MTTNKAVAWYGWTAGIIDGEGSIGIPKNNYQNQQGKYRYSVHLCVRNTDKKMIDKLVELWGGRTDKKACDKRYKAKRVYGWYLPASKVTDFGTKILPYLITKRPQMLLALELRNRIENKKGIIQVWRKNLSGKHPSMWLTDFERSYRQKLREEIMGMNQRGSATFGGRWAVNL